MDEIFPLHPGNYWIYRGSATFIEAGKDGNNHLRHAYLRETMTVTETATQDGVFGALVNHAPLRGGWGAQGEDQKGLFVFLGTKKLYFLEGRDAFQCLWRHPQ